jgi:hypothetical protein
MANELLARLIEEVSIVATEKRRKEPIEVPRPDSLKSAHPDGLSGDNLRALVASHAVKGRVRRG